MVNKYSFWFGLILFFPLAVQAEGGWDFRLTPYAWFAGVRGEVSTIPGSPIVPIDVTPSEALSDSQASFMMFFEAKKQRNGMLFDILYTDSESDSVLIPAINLTMKSISRNKIFSAAYLFELYNKDRTVLDIFGGVRYWKVDTILEFGGGLGVLAGRRIRNAESWFDPMVGIKGREFFGASNFYTTAWLAAGGFGVGSENFYDLSANVGYQWNKSIGTTLGYRLFDVEYEEGPFFYDVKQEGWLLGLSWAF